MKKLKTLSDKNRNLKLKKHKTISNVIKRGIMSIIMTILFLFFVYIGEIGIYISVLIILITSFKEILSVMNQSTDMKEWVNNYIIWYLMIIINYYLIGGRVLKYFAMNRKKILVNNFGQWVINYLLKKHVFICFSGYISIIILYVLSLKSGYLRSQFTFFGLIHLIIIALASSSYAVIANVREGIFWFVFPIALVASNDIFAYITGKLFGRTQLIKLSPNKTVEGFMGGFIFTALMGYILSYIRLNYNIFKDCYTIILRQHKIINLYFYSVSIPSLYLHAIPFVLFASFIAPFGGFFASGFKRAYNAKDFGESIPGHGGIADRIDCQLINGIFTHVYLLTFLVSRERRIEKTYNFIIKNFNDDQIIKLVKLLANRILN